MAITFKEAQPMIKKYIQESQYVIIKLGTNLLTPFIQYIPLNKINEEQNFFLKLAERVKKIQDSKKNVIIVSSGAVGFGKAMLLKNSNYIKKISLNAQTPIIQKQAFASLGQSLLMDIYRNEFKKMELVTAQILVSGSNFRDRTSYKNLKNTIDQLLTWKVIPIINENDSVAIEELSLGDNDTLASSIAGMYPQSILTLLTTIDGFYIDQKRQTIIKKITSKEMKQAGQPLPGGVGGMKTKLYAAKKIMRSGQLMNISSGSSLNTLDQIMNGEDVGTWFFSHSPKNSLKSIKRWLLHNQHSMGCLEVDEGAEKAISESASLLAVGLKNVEGNFFSGDIVFVKNEESQIFAKGVTSLSSKDLKSLKDPKGVEIIHRDKLLIL